MALADQFQLSQDATYQGRVQAALVGACVAISNEGWSVPFHRERATFAAQILSAGATQSSYVTLFANACATDPTSISLATANSSVPLTAGNRATQSALVTDTAINNAIASMFNSFVREPAN